VIQYAASDPAGFLLLQAKKLRLLLGGNEIYRNQAIYPERSSSPILAALLWKIPGLAFPFGILLPIAAVGLVIGGRRAPLLAGSVAIYALSIVAFFIAARYRVPLVPLLLVFAAEGGRWLWKEATAPQRLFAIVGMAAAFAIANLGQGRMESRMNADAEYSVGVRLALAGHPIEARDRFRRALELKPGYAEAWSNLGVIEARGGNTEAAGRAFLRAVELAPDETAALANLAIFYEKQNRLEEAARLYDRILTIDPGDSVAEARLQALRARATPTRAAPATGAAPSPSPSLPP
jgi:tetratricopeptide (TPR) repeat protein